MTDDELTELIDSLDQYDEARVRAAIETARDPDVGPRLVDRLAGMLDDGSVEADRFARAALAVVVVEADAAGAFDTAFEHLMDGGGDFIDDVLEYVLARQGERVVRRAMAELDAEDEPGTRGVLYALLQAANGRDPALVADAVAACHAEWEYELKQPADDPDDDDGGWTPAISLCYTLVILGDASAREMIAGELAKPRRAGTPNPWKAAADYAARFLGQHTFDAERTLAEERLAAGRARLAATEPTDPEPTTDPYEAADLVDDVVDDGFADGDLDWRQDWTVQMPRWAKVYDPAEQGKLSARFMAPLREILERMASSYGLDEPGGEDDVVYADDFTPPLLANEVTMPIRAEQKVGRNDPCPCGSGKKYKKCHGAAGGGGGG